MAIIGVCACLGVSLLTATNKYKVHLKWSQQFTSFEVYGMATGIICSLAQHAHNTKHLDQHERGH